MQEIIETFEGDPLYDPNRHTRVQVIEWEKDGFPIFGEPVMDTRNVEILILLRVGVIYE